MIWCFARWERERRAVDAKRNKHRERVGDMEWGLSFPSLPTQWGYGPEAAFDVRVKLALLWLISALEYLPNVSIWVLWSVFIVFEDKSISFTHMASSVWCSSKEIEDLFRPWDIMVVDPQYWQKLRGVFGYVRCFPLVLALDPISVLAMSFPVILCLLCIQNWRYIEIDI